MLVNSSRLEVFSCCIDTSTCASNKFCYIIHNDVIKWKHFPRHWPFVKGIHRSPVDSPHKGQWRWAFIFFDLLLNKRLNKQSGRRWFKISRLFAQTFVQAQIKIKHQSSASLNFVRGPHRWPVISPHKAPVMRICFHSMTSPWGWHHYDFNLDMNSWDSVKPGDTWTGSPLVKISACRLARLPIYIIHYCDVIMGVVASQIISLAIVYSPVYSDADQRKYQSSASLAFVREIHRGPVNSPHNWPVTRKMFPFDDFIMFTSQTVFSVYQ